jgi:hypothetical protein
VIDNDIEAAAEEPEGLPFDRPNPKDWIRASQRAHALRAIVDAYHVYRAFEDEKSAVIMRLRARELPSIVQHVPDLDAMGKAAEAELKDIEARALEEREETYAAYLRARGQPDMRAILSALQPDVSPRRRVLFQMLLFPDWWNSDLLRHRCQISDSQIQREVARARTHRLDRVRRQAVKLRDAVRALDPKGRFHLGWLLACTARRDWRLSEGDVEAALVVIEEQLAALAVMRPEKLLTGSEPNSRGRPRARFADAVIADLAELFKVVAYPTKATRRIGTQDQGAAGRDYGPFFEFSRAVWAQVFGSEDGLSDAMKRWRSGANPASVRRSSRT